MLDSTLWFLIFAGMIFFLPSNLIYFVLLVAGIVDIRKSRAQLLKRGGRAADVEAAPGISVLAPAFNMEASILPSVAGLLLLDYPDFEVIVINDGSSDRTMELLVEAYALEPLELPEATPLCKSRIRGLYRSKVNPMLRVLDKVNGGHKADALNAGLTYVGRKLFCAVDADSLLERDALHHIVRPFLSDPKTTIASGGTIRVINDSTFIGGRIIEARVSKNPLVLFQVVEYIRAFYTGRTGWNRFKSLIVISGAFGLFRTSAVKGVGGYGVAAIGEDMELVLRLHHEFRKKKIPYKMGFVPEAVCWTEVPDTIHGMYVQRHRWQRGLLDSLNLHRTMFLNPRYGALGFLALPYFLSVEAFGPVIECFLWGVLYVAQTRGLLSFGFWLAFVLVSLAFSWAMSMCSILVEVLYFAHYSRIRDFFLLTIASVVEPFGYRQVTAVWRLLGTYSFLRGDKRWGKFKRKGFGSRMDIAENKKPVHDDKP